MLTRSEMSTKNSPTCQLLKRAVEALRVFAPLRVIRSLIALIISHIINEITTANHMRADIITSARLLKRAVVLHQVTVADSFVKVNTYRLVALTAPFQSVLASHIAARKQQTWSQPNYFRQPGKAREDIESTTTRTSSSSGCIHTYIRTTT